MSNYLLGIDVGTTGSKAVLMGEGGAVVGSASEGYPLHTPHPQWSEQDPEDWWRGAAASTRRVLETTGIAAQEIAGVGLTGQMHGLVLLNGKGEVLRPAILWNDQRTGAECAAITREVGRERVLELTGNPVLPGFTAPKVRWVAVHEPEVFRRTAKVLLPKDYVRYRLTGAFFSDVADASGTALFNVRERCWSDEMLHAVRVPRAWLPEATESTEVSARLNAEGARATGLPEGTPVVAGAGDQAAGGVGAGVVAEGSMSVVLGTSGVVFAASERYRFDPEGRLHAFCHAVPGAWHLMGVTLSAAGSFRWYHDTLGDAEQARAEASGGDAYDLLTEAAAQVPPGSEGLLFLPYLTGERTPHLDADARGAFVGLTLRHAKAHLTRAVLEGVAFSLKDAMELMCDRGLTAGDVRLAGGGARSALWRQILADVLSVELHRLRTEEGAAYGAALLAAVGAGVYPNVEAACRSAVAEAGSVCPGPAAPAYAACYPRYQALYPALKGAQERK